MAKAAKPKKEISVLRAYSVYIFLSNVYREIIKKGLYTALKALFPMTESVIFRLKWVKAELLRPPDWSSPAGAPLHFS